MTFLRNVVLIAAVAGLFASLVMTAMQAYSTVPLILKAETFENAGGEATHDHGTRRHRYGGPCCRGSAACRRRRSTSIAKRPGHPPTVSSDSLSISLPTC